MKRDAAKKTPGDAPKVKKLLHMDAAFADSLEICAHLEGVSQSEILRRALAAYFKAYDRSKIKRFAEKAKALDAFK